MMLFFAILIILISPILVACIRTVLLSSSHLAKQKKIVRDKENPTPVDQDLAARHLSESIRFKTVSNQDAQLVDWSQFEAFHAFLKETYPLVHRHLQVQTLGHNLIFRWQGTDCSLEPALLTAHQDVVPAGNESQWTHPPFEGVIDQGYIWGRGTFDVKIQMIAILEAFEALLNQGYSPKRTYIAAFGCDEEVFGVNGAVKVAQLFKEEGLHFSMVLDEGGAVAENYIPGLDRPVAAIGVAEKGIMNVTLSCTLDGGHSSTPKNPTSLGVVAKAIARIEQKPAKARYTEPVKELFYNIGLESGFPYSLLFLNIWLFKPVLTKILSKNRTLNSFIRTTHATTMAQGSTAANVIAPTAQATTNFRLLPGDDEQSVLDWTKKTIQDDRIILTASDLALPSHVSPVHCPEFQGLTDTIRTIFPQAIPTSYLMMGGTDAKRYQEVCDHIYRFTPVQMPSSEISRMHGYDERISLTNVGKAVEFFIELIRTF